MNIRTVTEIFEFLIDEVVEKRSEFVIDPQRDMTRNRRISFRDALRFIMLMSGGTTFNEMLDYFSGNSIPSVSAFVQQRSKIHQKAFEHIARRSSQMLNRAQTFEGYRLVAVDGSRIHIPLNPMDETTFFPGTNGQRPYNLMHLNSAYDILNNIYLDFELQDAKYANENLAFTKFADRCGLDKTIFIADRNYESYNSMAHCQENGHDYIIRIKDRERQCIKAGLDLPDDEFDVKVELKLTRKSSKETRLLFQDRNHYRWIPTTSTFDYLDRTSYWDKAEFYTLRFRIVRFQLDNGEYEVLVTSLDEYEFPANKLKELYAMRWGIETSYRTLKYAGGLLAFHSKKKTHVIQEIYACIAMYNLASLASADVITARKDSSQCYRVNNAKILCICKKLFLGKIAVDCAEYEMQRSISAIRRGRSFKRPPSRKIVFEFIYRVA